MTIPPLQPPNTMSPPLTSTAAGAPPGAASAVPPGFAAHWTALFQADRQALASTSNLASWLGPVEQQNLGQYWGFLEDLAANRSDADVMWDLEQQHGTYSGALQQRTSANTVAIQNVRRVIQDPIGSGVPKARSATVLDQLHIVALAYTKFGDLNNALARDLTAVLRRGKRRRFFVESAHTVLVLAVFNILFGKVSEAVCGWIKLGFGVTPSPRVCSEIWFAATLGLFVAERWLAGPRIDAWIAKRTRRIAEEVLVFYFRDRTHLEYQLAILETLIAQTRADLKGIGVAI